MSALLRGFGSFLLFVLVSCQGGEGPAGGKGVSQIAATPLGEQLWSGVAWLASTITAG